MRASALKTSSQATPGTSSIVHETTHQPLLSTLSALVETVVHLREQGHKVVLVSSGAIGVGLKRMEVATRPKSLSKKQVCTSVRCARAILTWVEGFSSDRAGPAHRAVGQPLRTAGTAYRPDPVDSRGHLRRTFCGKSRPLCVLTLHSARDI